MRVILKRGNDQVVTLTGLKATDLDTYLNEAIVTASLLNSRGVVIPEYENIPMTYLPGSDGDYEWVIESSDMMLPKNVEYSLEIKAEQEGLNYRVVHPVSVVDGE